MTSVTTHEKLLGAAGDSSAGKRVITRSLAATTSVVGERSTRFALAAVIAWIGAMKFTAYEAEAISGLVQNSPLISWVYSVVSVRGFGIVLGVIELSIASMIAAGFVFRKVGALGALLAIGMFLTTLSFIVTTPGVFEPSLGGFPALSVMPGQFLVKDMVLLGASVWLLGQSLGALAD